MNKFYVVVEWIPENKLIARDIVTKDSSAKWVREFKRFFIVSGRYRIVHVEVM